MIFSDGLEFGVVTLTLSGRKVLGGAWEERFGCWSPQRYMRLCFGWERGEKVVGGVQFRKDLNTLP